MSYHDKEIIKKIEAGVKKVEPTVLSSKRSAFLNQKRLGGGVDCGSPCIVISNEGGTGSITIYDPGTGQSTLASHPQFIGAYGEIAKFGNKFWLKTTINNVTIIKEFEIDSNCSINHIRDINIPSRVSQTGQGMCAKDINTLIVDL